MSDAASEVRGRPRMTITLQRALLTLLAAAFVATLVPAGVVLDHRLRSALEVKARRELLLGPGFLGDLNRARADALMMHAKEAAHTAGLGSALAADRVGPALRLLQGGVVADGERPVLVDARGRVMQGPRGASALAVETRAGQMPVAFVADSGAVWRVALAPVQLGGRWVGAAGVVVDAGRVLAGTLAGLTASDIVVLGGNGRTVAGAFADSLPGAAPDSAMAWEGDGRVHVMTLRSGQRYWVTVAPLGSAGCVVFLRSIDRELAALPVLRRAGLVVGSAALLVVLLLGMLIAAGLARPVRALAEAADRLAQGDFDAPLKGSSLREVDRMAIAFDRMRRALASRLDELRRANRELALGKERLEALQAEMIQRDRLVASGRLVAGLAHEIRNPVANVRNCLELIHRRVEGDAEAREFADLAIDELLRMHELAEQMLDLHRPMDPGASRCDVGAVAARVAALFRAAVRDARWRLVVDGAADGLAAIGPDDLKQVLLALLDNAREAMPGGGLIEIRLGTRSGARTVDVVDTGPGIPPDVLPRIFDPLFTTKSGLDGVGLGLFVAEGVVRRHGGRLSAGNRTDGRTGAWFRVELRSAAPGQGDTDAGRFRGATSPDAAAVAADRTELRP
jgi:signal transduction histidine kinase